MLREGDANLKAPAYELTHQWIVWLAMVELAAPVDLSCFSLGGFEACHGSW